MFIQNMIKFENVGLRYGLSPEVLHNMTFAIERKSFKFLTGPSGSGKSSVLKLMYFSLKPSRGVVRVFGHNTTTLRRSDMLVLRRQIGIVFQDFRLLDHMTVFENTALPLRVAGLSEDGYRGDVHDLLNWVGLGQKVHVYPPALSGGEKQRVAIARAVITRPELLLADEPTGNVDPDIAHRLIRLFEELNKTGTTILVATHDVSLMAEYKYRRIVLNSGVVSTYD